jgi:hypothetical protein
MFSRWLHLSPKEVDSLRIRDFLALCNGIDQELKAREAAANG